MIWYKSWLDTRSRFLVGLVLLVLSACGTVFYYPQVLKLMPMANTIEASGELGRRIREGVALAQQLPRLRLVAVDASGDDESGDPLRGAAGSGRPVLASVRRLRALRAVDAGVPRPRARRARRHRPWGARRDDAGPGAPAAAAVAGRRRTLLASSTRWRTVPVSSSPQPPSSAWRCCSRRSSPTCGVRY